ncbi:hypothetical protein [Phaeobacter inhibens]|uniref:hypothetical protein n=1 Tax=Phaeobacter inhibens TaxID=221822 RepID=UPI000C9A853B|nr:hypothetical protein [Phaeobacter inhibens]AUQ72398.1 hypothetical protein PhaeoP54_03565 [Phaeobacter inhibens]UWR84478.1 hypothetical protein K4L05_17475 [Phaeobacter inhibens]
MARHTPAATPIEPTVLDLVREERGKALSPREWKFRLRGYGYAIKDIEGAQILTRLPHGKPLGALPAEFS